MDVQYFGRRAPSFVSSFDRMPKTALPERKTSVQIVNPHEVQICHKLMKVKQMQTTQEAAEKRSSSAIVGPVFQRPVYHSPRTPLVNNFKADQKQQQFQNKMNSTATTSIWPKQNRNPKLSPLRSRKQTAEALHLEPFAVNGILDSTSRLPSRISFQDQFKCTRTLIDNSYSKVVIHEKQSFNGELAKLGQMKNKMNRHQKRENKVLWEVAVQRLKNELFQQLLAKFPFISKRLTLTKVRIMRIEDLFKLAEKLEINQLYQSKAVLLQRWWRNKLAKWRFTFKPAIARYKAACRLQRWWTSIKLLRLNQALRAKRDAAARVIQRAARKTILRPNNLSYLFIAGRLTSFGPMRHKLLTDFQIKIAYHYRKHLKRVAEKKRIAEEKRRKKLAAAAKKKGKGGKAKKGKAKKKAQTMTPDQAKSIIEGKDEKNMDDLEQVDPTKVDINVDGEPLEPEEDEDNRPSSQVSRKSKGTAENKSDFEDDDALRRSTLQDGGGEGDPLLERESNADQKDLENTSPDQVGIKEINDQEVFEQTPPEEEEGAVEIEAENV